jgi:plastocyanin
MRLTITPPYLDANSHEALYEIDVAVLEGRGHPNPRLPISDKVALAAEGEESMRMNEERVSHITNVRSSSRFDGRAGRGCTAVNPEEAMPSPTRRVMSSWILKLVLSGCLVIGFVTQTAAQIEQRVDVRIRDFTFIASQAPLMLNVPVVITIRNEDRERHNFESVVFQGISTEVEAGGVVTYGRGLRGVFLDADGGAVIRFTVKRPGRYQFKCSIHPRMKGELLLLDVQRV